MKHLASIFIALIVLAIVISAGALVGQWLYGCAPVMSEHGYTEVRQIGPYRCKTGWHECNAGYCCPENTDCATGGKCVFDGEEHFSIPIESDQ